MRVSITGRHMEVSDILKQYIVDRIEKFDKIEARFKDVSVVLAVEKYRKIAEIVLKVDSTVLNSKEETEDMYVSIDHAVEKISRQLVKHKGKLKENKNREENLKALSASIVGTSDENDEDETEDRKSVV